MRYKLKWSVTLLVLKYMYVPEAEDIKLEYYKSFNCEAEIIILFV